MTKRTAIIIPAYNEATVVAGVLKDIHKTFGDTVDVIVVDDASTDDTGEVARANGARVIRHVLNGGMGAGLPTSTGLRAAELGGYDYVITMDADGQHVASDAKSILEHLQKHKLDLVIGSRLIDATGMSATKQFGNWGLSVITYLLFGVRVADSQSGLRALSRRAVTSIKLRSAGYEFCSEMLWRARQEHLKIAEAPIQAIYTDYSKGKGQNNWNGFTIVRSLIKQRLLEIMYE